MKLYLIRHGESVNNEMGCYTGWIDAPLTESGIKQAENLRSYISHIEFDKIYSSDLSRARRTAETAIPGCTYEATSLLREINLGELSGKKISDCPRLYGDEFEINRSKSNYKPYGGECDSEFIDRMEAFLRMVSESGYKNVAAFAHGGFLTRCRDLILGTRLSGKDILCRNCTIEILEFEGGKWKLHSWINTQ